MRAKIILLAMVILIVISLSNIMALTASIGNSRMILRGTTGEIIDRYILVKNVNDAPVSVNFVVSGDLKDTLNLKENNFQLKPGEDKKAYFTIKSEKSGSTETKINVVFTPEEGNAVGLTATIILIASGEDIINQNNFENLGENSKIIENQEGKTKNIRSNKNNIFDYKLLIITSLVLTAILISLFFYSISTKRKETVKMANA